MENLAVQPAVANTSVRMQSVWGNRQLTLPYFLEVVRVLHVLVQYTHYGGTTYTLDTFACSETCLRVDG